MENYKKILTFFFVLPGLILFFFLPVTPAQSTGSAGTIQGTVVDPSNAVVPAAKIKIENSVSGYKRSVDSDEYGNFRFENIPPNDYQLSVSASGFNPSKQNVSVRSAVPATMKVALTIASVSEAVTVESGAPIIENVPSAHTDLDQTILSRLPASTPGAGLSDAVALAVPGVVADSNGFFHPLGDHAESSVSLDNQPISDQQSKAFSAQIPLIAIQSMEVINGSIPAEYGDKTSMVINAITRSGLGQTKPAGSFTTLYGSFGTSQEEATLGAGNSKSGNFVAFNFERSGRFLDAPELVPLHDIGTSGSIFDRVDYNPTAKDSLHLNIFIARNSFQIPNQYDQAALGQDQRQLVRSMNIAPGYVRTFSQTTIMTISPYFRLDQIWYFPSSNPISDQTQTISQQRRLNNVGIRGDVNYVKGINNIKAGVQVSHTFLTEAFQFGITDPDFNAPAGPNFLPGLLPFDLTRGGRLFNFNGHTDIKQEAAYAQDAMTLGQVTFSLGMRFDNYNGISKGSLIQPRAGVSYLFKPTNTILRGSYIRTFETPYNENLILSSATGAGGLATNGVLDLSTSQQALKPGRRNQFNVGIQQSFSRHVVVDVDYFWKYTHNAYDFSALFNTPITFPISWSQSKIDGVAMRVNLNDYKGLSAYFVSGHTRARFFPPETGGLFFNSNLPGGVFRIDHDQVFEHTAMAQYQFNQIKQIEPFIAFTWRYDSGVVAGSVPNFATALTLTPDQQAQIGLFCGSTFATPGQGLSACDVPNRGATRLRIPADGTANNDHNPPRVAPRNLIDLSLGTNNLLRTEHKRMTLRLTAINITNRDALYNFLSTFSGTHFVMPRALQAQVGITF